jgi:hypothetical protein
MRRLLGPAGILVMAGGLFLVCAGIQTPFAESDLSKEGKYAGVIVGFVFGLPFIWAGWMMFRSRR